MSIDSKTGAMRKQTRAIDTVLATLYANDARGYMSVNPKVFKSAALKRIQSELSTLDKHARPGIEDETKYRIQEFEGFAHLPDVVRREILRLAKEQHLSIEDAYKQKMKK
jgi:hypothetical protein